MMNRGAPFLSQFRFRIAIRYDPTLFAIIPMSGQCAGSPVARFFFVIQGDLPPSVRQNGSTTRCAQPCGMRPDGIRGPRLGSWTPSRSRDPTSWARGPAAMTQAIRPTAASAASWSTPVVYSWSCRSPRRTPTEDGWFRTRRGDGQVRHGRIHVRAPRTLTRTLPPAARNGKMTVFPTTFLENLKSRGPGNLRFGAPDCRMRGNYGRNMILPTRPGAKFACAAAPASSKE